jgi:hypothetical protein
LKQEFYGLKIEHHFINATNLFYQISSP